MVPEMKIRSELKVGGRMVSGENRKSTKEKFGVVLVKGRRTAYSLANRTFSRKVSSRKGV